MLKHHYCQTTNPFYLFFLLSLEQRLEIELESCITGKVLENSPGIPPPPTRLKATLTLSTTNSVIDTTCNAFNSTSINNPPYLEGEDPFCKEDGKSPRFFYKDSNPTQVADSDYPCGTVMLTRTWTALDGCRDEVEPAVGVDQTIYIRPDQPIFEVPTLPEPISFTTSQSPIPSRAKYPSAVSYCGGRTTVEYEDISITPVVDTVTSCTSWTMHRKWTAWEELDGCSGDDRPTSEPFMQTVTVTDDTLPEFISPVMKTIRVPFYDNYQLGNNVPKVRDTLANVGYGDFASQFVNKVTLSSTDDDLIKATAMSNELTCSSDGLARFNRTWIIRDVCDNTYEEFQNVIIEHPTSTKRSTVVEKVGDFPRSVGVSQRSDGCAPGKDLQLGVRRYDCTPEESTNNTTLSYICTQTSIVGVSSNEVLAVKPEFSFRPIDITIFTDSSTLPVDTGGEALGNSFCKTPYEILYTDSTKVIDIAYDTWMIERTWVIRPVYLDCLVGVNENDERLADSFIQQITVTPQPSMSPSTSGQPSSIPSESPSISAKPSSPPSSIPSESPSASANPSRQIETVTVTGNLNFHPNICTMEPAQLAEICIGILQTVAQYQSDPENVEIESTCCGIGSTEQRDRSLLSSRKLQETWQFQFQITEAFTCEVPSCDSPADDEMVKFIVDNIAYPMSQAFEEDTFATVLSSNVDLETLLLGSPVPCLVAWGNVWAVPKTQINKNDDRKSTDLFYPDWENDSGTCLVDGNEPGYMRINPTEWLCSSLEECCERYYSGYNINKCMNGEGTGLWYVDYNKKRCVVDCDEGNGPLCGGIASPLSEELFAEPKTCCGASLGWLQPVFCEVSCLGLTDIYVVYCSYDTYLIS